MALANEIRDEILDEIVARKAPLRVVLETKQGDVFTGHTDEFIEVRLTAPKGAKQGDLLEVIPTEHRDGVLYVSI